MAGRQTAFIALAIGLALSFGANARDPLGLAPSDFHAIDSMERVAEGRPNEEARITAMKAYIRDDHKSAIQHFERAAYFADKYSQHSLSLMHWHGIGVAADRVQAYIWADLAAERGSRRLLLVRERMWSELSDAQRDQARQQGVAFYERYGDRVAQPRAESMMRRFATEMTGSRIGYDGRPMEIAGRPTIGTFAPQVGSMATAYTNAVAATPEQLYGGSRHDLAAYWAEQDGLLDGRVEVGPVDPVRERRR